MSPVEFSFQVILLSTTGVLSPGPLFFINILYGSKYGSFVGLKIALGHTIAEFPLITVLSYVLYTFSSFHVSDTIFKIIGTIGGIFILIFSILQIKSLIKDKEFIQVQGISKLKFNIRNPVLIGFIFTILNPFFLIWWFTIGSTLISESILNFGSIEGTSLLFFSHIWMDYFWLCFTSFMVNKGKSVINAKIYQMFVFVISVILGMYGIYLLFTSLSTWMY
ncbi:MAG TPA: LysE family transporter [Nitrososphaeraceae archaeon]|jgi:threonine/homoserine/homoserine lactone efflux protein|nr:LysE family transporter [Nitrososphaeraceae archaeon]